MKNKRRLIIVTISVLLIMATFVVSADATSDPFVGNWTSTDTDGSHQILTIGGGSDGSYHVRYYDFGASTCGLDPTTGEILYAASAEGTLSLSGYTLSGTLSVYCQTPPPSFHNDFTFQYIYDPETHTLIDSFGVVWSH
jgi:hypothetical protein